MRYKNKLHKLIPISFSPYKKTALRTRLQVIITTTLLSVFAASSAQSAPSFPDYPLVSGAANPVPPNVVLILDDSGSMQWTFMPSRELGWNEGNISWTCYRFDNKNWETYYRGKHNAEDWVMREKRPDISGMTVEGNQTPCMNTDPAHNKGPGRYLGGTYDDLKRFDNWILRSYINNTIYYNPGVTYLPWRTADMPPSDPAIAPKRMDNADVTGVSDHVDDLTGSLDLRDSPHAYFYVPNVKTDGMIRDNAANYYKYRISQDTSGNAVVQRCDFSCNTANATWVNETPTMTTIGGRDPIHDEFSQFTPRSQSDEVQNFANWFHYHSTRMKMAKAGASEAFGQLNSDIRIGYDTINSSKSAVTGSIVYPVPHNIDGGEFKGTNRTGFYEKLQGQTSEGDTPLLAALRRSGEYYKMDGPYKNGSGNLISCRRNYAVLVTDGAWTDGGGGPYPYLYRIAHHYWSTDLRDGPAFGLANNVPSTGKDYANWQHMNTFGISVGMASKYTGTLDPQYSLNPSYRKNTPDYTLETAGGEITDGGKIDDLALAAAEGYGSFSMANDTNEFIQALERVFSAIGGSKSSSNVAVNSNKLTSDTRIYNASFQSGAWLGELNASSATSGAKLWSLSATFNSSGTDFHNEKFSERTILRGRGAGNNGASLFDKSVSDNALARTSGPDLVSVADNISWLRGDQSKEKKQGGNLRTRDWPIGDIVNSSPAYSADTTTVYVGANDGMLHAISDEATDGGKVLFSYIPGGVDLNTLATLSSPKYEHRFFVDGSIDVMPRAHHGAKTLLLAAMGRGGRGVFSLDISDPKTMSSAHVLWDDTVPASNTSYMPDMGYVLGGVFLRRIAGQKRVALIPNGIDSPSGNAALIVREINADGSAAAPVVLSTNEGGGNGLMSLALADVDQNGTVDLVYGGDLKGNVWRWDFRNGIPAAGTQPAKLFSGTASRAITGGLVVSALTAENKIFVGFGTGRYISLSDLPGNSSAATQRLYGIIDQGDDNPPRTLSDTDLTRREMHGSGEYKAFDPYEALPVGSEGWYVDFTEAGERVIYPPNIAGPTMYITSAIPDSGTIQGDPCDSASGGGYVYAINLFTGTGPERNNPYFQDRSTGSTPTMTVKGQEVPVGGKVNSTSMPTGVQLMVGDEGKIDVIYEQGNGSLNRTDGLDLPDTNPEKKGRLSWREILRF